ncbi:MAG TPA: carboxypeptidase-like regulatory domain-containing protein, partial [Pontibacter sp.]
MRLRLLAAGLCCLFATNALAQLKGTLKDESGSALPYANVTLLHLPDSAGLTGAMSADDGSFTIPAPAPGKYILRVSMIGYIPHYTSAFQVSGTAFSKDFGALVLRANAHALSEVSVKALRPAITMEADKLVMSVEGTTIASGSTAY